jgi:hypothetical protein
MLLLAGCLVALWFSASRREPADRSTKTPEPPRLALQSVPKPVAPPPTQAVQPPAVPRPAAAPAPAKPQRPPYDPVTEPPLLRGGDGVRVERTWGGNGRDLSREFGRHGREFQTTSIFRYAAMAAYFFQEAPDRGFPTKIGEDGVIRIYDPGSNTYGEYNADGTTRLFLRPERRAEFWAEQPGVEPISP